MSDKTVRALLPEALIVLGVALFVYGASFFVGSPGNTYTPILMRATRNARLEMTGGAALGAAGILLGRRPTKA